MAAPTICFGNGKTILRAAYSKYVASESTNMATLNNRVNTSVNQATRTWTDTNGNFKPDCDLSNPAAQTVPGGDTCGLLNAPLGNLNVAAAYDSAITSGFGVRPNDQEVAAGLQQQVHPRVALDFQFTRHAFGNFIAAQNTTRPPSAYNSYCVTRRPTRGSRMAAAIRSAVSRICRPRISRRSRSTRSRKPATSAT